MRNQASQEKTISVSRMTSAPPAAAPVRARRSRSRTGRNCRPQFCPRSDSREGGTRRTPRGVPGHEVINVTSSCFVSRVRPRDGYPRGSSTTTRTARSGWTCCVGRIAPARGPPLWHMADARQGEFDSQAQPAPDYKSISASHLRKWRWISYPPDYVLPWIRHETYRHRLDALRLHRLEPLGGGRRGPTADDAQQLRQRGAIDGRIEQAHGGALGR
jgi:hypothetical protein